VITSSRIQVVSDVKKPTVSRQERAAVTRGRMLDAAYDLFCEQGFRATTMGSIAERAGVAVQTLYFTFHTKDALLQEVHDRTVLGDDPVPPAQQAWHVAAMAEPDGRRALAQIIKGVRAIEARVAPMIPVFQAVSADAAGKVFRRGEELRRNGFEQLIDALAAKTPLRPGLTRAKACDLLFVVLGPELYRSLVLECGWSQADWQAWATSALTRDLFGGEPGTS
jgi:AcrR family transcriptional regulator